jgi:hypothetical protein
MAHGDGLSASEMTSLREVGKGLLHGNIPEEHALRLLHLRLIYKMLGDLHITTAGRTALRH